MNFLAHIFLSGNDQQIIIGNFIADGIKGKYYLDYPKKLQIGILLHREIDTFTDKHPLVRKSTRKLHQNYGHYSGIIVDILYDHFLAKNWHIYSDVPLAKFVDDFYNTLQDNFEILPERIQKMMPYMIADNWLVSYASIAGIGKILAQMNYRTKNISKMNLAVAELEDHYDEFENEFTFFFEELIYFSAKKIKKLCDIYSS